MGKAVSIHDQALHRSADSKLAFSGNSSKDVVLRHCDEYRQSLPDIEHYFILMYYQLMASSNPSSSIAQLFQFWLCCYTECKHNNVTLPAIYIGKVNVSQIFDLLSYYEFHSQQFADFMNQFSNEWNAKYLEMQPDDYASSSESDPIEIMVTETENVCFYNLYSVVSNWFICI